MKNSIKMAGHRKSVKKAMEDYVDRGEQELDLQDRGIENLLDVPFLSKCQALLSHLNYENIYLYLIFVLLALKVFA